MTDTIRKRLSQPYVWLYLAAMIATLLLVYFGTHLFLPYLPSYRLDMRIDAFIPCVPEWISVYCLAYPSWVVSAVIILAQGKEHAIRFSGACILALIISCIIFLAWPLTMERPEIIGDGLLRELLRAIYRADPPNNLFPSLHVLASYVCWRGLLGCPRIPGWFKGFNFVFFVLVCFSVVLVKQHLMIDIPGGIIVGEASIQAMRGVRFKQKKA
ncbi:MAG: phosphatidic acid phosphatase [Clostridia bacterium]|nr:phosphatidic acid phosphatase [Clostridia bacterium]